MLSLYLLIAWGASVRGPALHVVPEVSHQPGDGAALAEHAGLTPKVLAVSGVTASQANLALARLEQTTGMSAYVGDLRSQVRAAAERVGVLRTRFRSEQGNAEVLAQLRQAKSQLSSAKAQLEVARANVMATMVTGLGQGVTQRLAVSRTSRNQTIPAELQCVERNIQERRQIESALVIERRAQRCGQEVPAEVAARLASARGHEAVVAARQALSSELPAIQNLFGPH